MITEVSRDNALPDRDSKIEISPIHFVNKKNVIQNYPNNSEEIYLGLGCFWGAERKFWHLDGLYTTAVGYAGGHTDDPNYEKVCTGTTGHSEVVKVIYDEKKIKLNELLKIFWESHNPTQLNRQGNDIGTQYRSIILTDQKNLINKLKESKEKFQKLLTAKSLGTIHTEIEMIKNFYVAEDYHQKYLYKNPNGYCGLKGLEVNYT